jgi:hypothetical protein
VVLQKENDIIPTDGFGIYVGNSFSTADIILPLANTTTGLSGILMAHPTTNGYTIGSYTIDQLYSVCHGDKIDTARATRELVLFFYLENQVFGTTSFYHIPAKLFPKSTVLDTDGNKTITIKDKPSNTSSLLITSCVTVVCSWCRGNDPSCPNGGSWEECTTIYIPTGGGSIPWPNGPTGGPAGTGGGSNPTGGNGGTPPPCPGSVWYGFGEGPCPNLPPPPVYQLSANDIRVINQLNAEDQETDNILANSDCEGTLRTGNINFNGTKEHWLIQLDYIATHPLGGEREYAIPQSSPSGNRGYADLVNKVSREIFEIKPNNPQGIIDGEAEVARYVQKANQFCPSSPGPLPSTNPWLKGNNYTKTVLPSTIPTQYLVADKIAPGVIGYKYEPKTNNPSPLPIVIPSSVLDKLRTLVERLKANVNDANRIIAQYLAQHPELVTYIKSAAIGAAVAIVVGTIIEDFATAGVGILDDWASFTLAYKIVRFAWAL